MEATKSELEKITDILNEYMQTVKQGRNPPQYEFSEVNVSQGEVWIHPDNKGNTIDIHLIDSEGQNFNPVKNHVIEYLSQSEDFKEAETLFDGGSRKHIRADYNF